MENAEEKRKYTFDEYIQLEKELDVRHEFWNGDVFAMAGGTANHNRISLKIASVLLNHFEPKGCKVFINDVKLELDYANYYVYPDVLLTCSNEDTNNYYVKNPSLIVEVISASTENYDRSTKLGKYRNIKSLRYYLLVSQLKPHVEIYARKNENELLTFDVVEGMDAIIQMPVLDFELPLRKIYEHIEFENE